MTLQITEGESIMSESNEDEKYSEKYQFWQPHINAWKQSGISQADFCRQHGLNIKIFGYWKRKLCSRSEGLSFVPVSIKPSHTAYVKSISSLRVVTCNGLSIEVGDGFNPATLRMLLDAIGQRV